MRSYFLVFVLVLAFPSATLAQPISGWGTGVKVITQLTGYVFDWSPDGRRLAHVVHRDIFILKGPDFSQPQRLPPNGWPPPLPGKP
jgi:hypothetical protein